MVAVTEPPPPVTIWHPPEGGTWIAAYHDTDPIAAARGGLRAPEAETKRLKRLHEAGVRPDVILIGHQLEKRWQPGDPVPTAYLPGEQAALRRILNVQTAAFGIGWDVLRAMAGLGVGVGAAAVLGAAAFAGAAVDPFVLGGAVDKQRGLIGWAYLGGWHESAA